MASARERRAALAAISETGRVLPLPPLVSNLTARLVDDDHTEDTEEDPMKILFTSVDLHKALPRLDAGKGQATQDTTRHHVNHGVIIEYDTATQLVRLSKGTAVAYVPLAGVERFGPTLDDAALHAVAQAQIAEAKRLANEAAAADAATLAALPA